MKTLSDQIRRAIETSGQSRYRISQTTGIPESSLSYFMSGRRGLSLESLDLIGMHLGLVITTKAKLQRKGK